MKKTRDSFSRSLLRNYLISSAIVLMIITILISNVYSRNYNKDMETLMRTSMFSINSSINTYLKELEQASMMPYYNDSFLAFVASINRRKTAPNTLDKLNIENAVGNMLTFSQFTRDDIVGTLIANDNYCLFNSTQIINVDLDDSYRYGASKWYRKAIDAGGKAVFLPPETMEYYVPNTQCTSFPEVLSVVRTIENIRTKSPLCVIRIDASTAAFDDMFNSIEWHVPSIMIITDESDNVVYSNHSVDKTELANLHSNTRQLKYDGKKWQVYSSDSNKYHWKIYVLLNSEIIKRKSNYIYLISAVFYAFGLVIAAIIFSVNSRKMVETVETINKITEEIKKGNLDFDYEFNQVTGLQQVFDSVQYMTHLLSEKIQQEYKLRLQQKEFQFRALQSQINPHFLFNSLNGLIGLNQIGESEKLDHSLHALTNMLHYILGAAEKSTVTDEMEFVNDYCALQKLRFPSKLNYSINYDPEVGDYFIPKLLLQPLVENAIIHGIEPSLNNCYLDIDILKLDNGMLITIEDNGIGFDSANSKAHVGINNVRQRLSLLNENNNLTIESAPGQGTVVTITIHIED